MKEGFSRALEVMKGTYNNIKHLQGAMRKALNDYLIKESPEAMRHELSEAIKKIGNKLGQPIPASVENKMLTPLNDYLKRSKRLRVYWERGTFVFSEEGNPLYIAEYSYHNTKYLAVINMQTRRVLLANVKYNNKSPNSNIKDEYFVEKYEQGAKLSVFASAVNKYVLGPHRVEEFGKRNNNSGIKIIEVQKPEEIDDALKAAVRIIHGTTELQPEPGEIKKLRELLTRAAPGFFKGYLILFRYGNPLFIAECRDDTGRRLVLVNLVTDRIIQEYPLAADAHYNIGGERQVFITFNSIPKLARVSSARFLFIPLRTVFSRLGPSTPNAHLNIIENAI
ncbi:MAG: hypothetical protein L6416_06640 [Candidatus Omnitrophica bacterium]|nr:hypothetical protein [Candidatus Omnitrophota bacterium]